MCRHIGGKRHIVLCVLTLSMYLNIETVVSQLLAAISADFPDRSLVAVQRVFSIIFLVEFLTQFVVGWFACRMSKRRMVITFQGLTVAGAGIAIFFGSSLTMLYLSSAVIGFAAAIISTISKSMVADYFTGDEIGKVLAAQQNSQAIGTIMLQMLTGILMKRSWRCGYLTFLFGVVSLLCGVFMLPETEPEKYPVRADGSRVSCWNRALVHDVLLTACFGAVTCTFSYNISYLAAEKNMADGVAIGMLSSVLTAATFAAACVFPIVFKRVKGRTVLLAFLLVLAGFLVIAASGSAAILIVGICMAGLGQGLFSPAVYSKICTTSQLPSASMAMVNMGAAVGMYLYPYLITAPASRFGTSTVIRFLFASLLLLPLIAAEYLYQRPRATAVHERDSR